MAIFISFGLFKDFRKKEVVRKGHEAPTREEGAPPVGRAPCLVGTSCASRTPFSCMLRILVGKNLLYILLKVLTTVGRPVRVAEEIFHLLTLYYEENRTDVWENGCHGICVQRALS